MNITNPLPNKYCHGTVWASSIFLTTYGPNDQRMPANKTIGIEILGFFNSSIINFYYLFFFVTSK